MITTKSKKVIHPAVDACNDLQRAIRRELEQAGGDTFYACNSARVQIALERLVMEVAKKPSSPKN